MTSVYGDMVLPSQLEAALKDFYATWEPSYLREMERRTGRAAGKLPPIRSWRAADDIADRFPEQRLPGVQLEWALIDTVGHADRYDGAVDLGLEVLVQSTSFNAARELAGTYAFMFALITVQKLPESPLFAGVGKPAIGLPRVTNPEQRRWLALGTVDFTAQVSGLMDPTLGPAAPGDDPPEYPIVATVELDVELVEPTP